MRGARGTSFPGSDGGPGKTEPSLESHINYVISQLDNIDSLQYQVAVHRFQQFVSTGFHEARKINEETHFLDKLFLSISLCHVDQNTLHFLALRSALLDVNLGDKVAKARRISYGLESIQPEPSHLWRRLLLEVLTWLAKVMRRSIHRILTPLTDIGWSCVDEEKPDETRISGYGLLSLFAENFPRTLENQRERLQRVIMIGLQSIATSDAALELLDIILRNNVIDTADVIRMTTECMKIFSVDKWELFGTFLKAGKLILSLRPTLTGCFTFTRIPSQLLCDPNLDAQRAILQFLPFAFRTTPLLFDDPLLNEIMQSYVKMVGRKSPVRKEAAISFADFVFASACYQTPPENVLIEIKKELEGDDDESAVYAMIAVMVCHHEWFDEKLIFARPLSNLIVDGLFSCAKICLNLSDVINDKILAKIREVIFMEKPPVEVMQVAYDTLNRMKLNVSSFQLPWVVKFMKGLTSGDANVRRSAARFLTSLQNETGSVDVCVLILAAVFNEPDEGIRLQMLQNIRLTEVTPTALRLLKMLLRDRNYLIEKCTLEILAEFADNAEIAEMLSQFMSEQIPDHLDSRMTKHNIMCFDILAVHLSKTRQLFLPFSGFLITHLIADKQRLPSAGFDLLSRILELKPEVVDVYRLVDHIEAALSAHSSKRRLDSALGLMLAALETTDLRFSVYAEHANLIVKLLEISKLSAFDLSREKLAKVLAVIGVMDPNLIENQVNKSLMKDKPSVKTTTSFINQSPKSMRLQNAIYASVGVALSHILNILLDESMSALRETALSALWIVLKTNRKVGGDLAQQPWFVNQINQILVNGSPSLVSGLLENTPTLISVLGNKFVPLIPHVVDFVSKKWSTGDKSLLVRIPEWLMIHDGDAFKPFMPRIVEAFFSDFHLYDDAKLVFSGLERLSTALDMVEHTVYPVLLDWLLYNSTNTEMCREVLPNFKSIFWNNGTEKYASEIVRTVVLVGPTNTEIHKELMDILHVVACQNGRVFLLHLDSISSVFSIGSHPLNDTVQRLITDKNYVWKKETTKKETETKKEKASDPVPVVNCLGEMSSSRAIPNNNWDESQWLAWCNELFANLMKTSASRAVSACATLTERNSRLREAIYPITLVIAYLQPGDGSSTIKNIFDTVLTSKSAPETITRHFLRAVELLEVMDVPLPIQPQILAEAAEKADMLAQSLRYYEAVKDQDSVSDKMILINQKLGLRLAANGILRHAKLQDDSMKESLGFWDDALKSYNEKLANSPDDNSLIDSKLRCLRALLRFEEMRDVSRPSTTSKAVACWNLFDYDGFMEAMSEIHDCGDDMIYRVWYEIVTEKTEEAKQLLTKMWEHSPSYVFPLISEDYERAVPMLSFVSLFSVTEEVIRYKKCSQFLCSAVPFERQQAKAEMSNLRKLWALKFANLPKNTGIKFSVIHLESLAISEKDLKHQWIGLLDTALDRGDIKFAASMVRHLAGMELQDGFREKLNVCACRITWEEGKEDEAIDQLLALLPSIQNQRTSRRANYILGSWLLKKQKIEQACNYVQNVVNSNPSEFEYWDLWARVSFAMFEATNDQAHLHESLKAAMVGMAKAPSPLSFSPRVLSTLFRRGNKEIYNIFRANVEQIPVHAWLEVLPQIIARLSSPKHDLLEVIHDLIISIGTSHPHPVLYSLLVPFKSSNNQRKKAAQNFIDHFRKTHPAIVDGVLHLANELIRVGATWWELTQTRLIAAEGMLNSKNHGEMLSILRSLHETVKQKPETFYEIAFQANFGHDMSVSSDHIENYRRTNQIAELNQAWSSYFRIFGRITPIISEMKVIPLVDASPFLASMKDAQIAVPGTYAYGQPLVTISKFSDKLTVISSKQRPRKMAIIGSDGVKYKFLLKAHEDTRLDERAMQLFKYINTLVDQSTLMLKRRLSIATYKVIPLTVQIGLIGWVPACLTLYQLLEQRRGVANIDKEYQMIKRYSPRYESLPLPDKAAAFTKGVNSIAGTDIKSFLLSGARDSSDWLDRRTTYTASLAATSISGYILGLGDRHMGNIMMKCKSAQLVHIDFGDCFEVAAHRAKYPEKVPFRLTRLLIEALEVSKIEGTFRSCCEDVMALLRANSDHILQLLEVFIYDPLMRWTDTGRQSALSTVSRIRDKLHGRDIDASIELPPREQVDALICQATDPSNLCCMFEGWGPWW